MPAANSQNSQPHNRMMALSEEKRARLLEPAEREFIRNGYNGASLNAILRAAGMSKGQAYYYIKNKADLYRLVCETAFETLISNIAVRELNPASAPEFWTSVHSVFKQVTLFFSQDKNLAVLGRGVYESAEAQAALQVPLRRVNAYFETYINIGQNLGAIRNDVPKGLIMAALGGAVRGMDQWFAANISNIPEGEALQLSEKTVGMLQAFAAPNEDIADA